MAARYVVPWAKYIPFGSGSFSRFGYTGWEWVDKYQASLDYGDAIVLVSPGKNWIYVSNAETIHDIIQRERRRDFERPVELLAVLDVFGPSISTVKPDDWQRHRKVTATAFSEKANRLVWTEALQQANQMLDYWKTPGEVRSTAKDLRTFALDVLVSAGFGKSFPFKGSKERPESGPLSYRDSLALILENALLILAMGPNLVSRVTFPTKLARVGQAIVSFKKFMVQDLEEEKKAIEEKRVTRENLMTNLVRASVESAASGNEPEEADGKRRVGLSQEEIFGNMFVFNFAGHDTTAHSLTYALYLLAAHPDVQTWINEEIRHVFTDADASTWRYESFPQLNRCLAVLYEALRLYNPLLSIVKGTAHHPAALTIDRTTHTVPPHTRVILNINAVHTRPRYWGHDSLDFNPSRWVLAAAGDGPRLDREYLRTPPCGTFMGWSDGSRACPGRRFAQVEHVAAVAALFWGHSVEPVRLEGEGAEGARKQTVECVEESGMRLLFQMLRPESVALRWERR